MKALLMDSKRYMIKVVGLAKRPRSIEPEKIKESEQEVSECILVFITVENDDPLREFFQKL